MNTLRQGQLLLVFCFVNEFVCFSLFTYVWLLFFFCLRLVFGIQFVVVVDFAIVNLLMFVRWLCLHLTVVLLSMGLSVCLCVRLFTNLCGLYVCTKKNRVHV